MGWISANSGFYQFVYELRQGQNICYYINESQNGNGEFSVGKKSEDVEKDSRTYMYGHLGAMSGMSPLIPVPFDFLSGGCWVMVQARKDRFRVEQAAAGTRPPPQCQPGSLCSFAPLLSALLL